MDDIRQKMEKALEILRQDLTTIKVGRVTPALVEKVMVKTYETTMPLVELATITAPDPNQLLITPFDQTIIKNIERALAMDRDLGLNPIVDENVIRVKIPPLTEERRRELVKVLGQKLEAGRVTVRQIRHDRMMQIKREFEAKGLNEDEKFQIEKDLQEMTDDFNKKIEEMGKQKESELLRT